jgi:thioredoxin-like negative regulator of GroEL
MANTVPPPARSATAFRLRTIQVVLLGLLISSHSAGLAQTPESDDRSRALRLCDENKFVEALPLLERMNAASPDDVVVLEKLAQALVAYLITLPDAAKRREAALRARKLIMHARELGDNSNVAQLLTNSIPPDGNMALGSFSNRKDADDALLKGDQAFARGDFPKAIEGYKRALELDPNLYQALLFLGDVYYKMNQPDEAGKWYAAAIKMYPDRETAYRYWADVLVKSGEMARARDLLIDAIVAEPYNRAPMTGLGQWANAARVKVAPPEIPIPDFKTGEKGQTTLTIDTSGNGSEAWIAYIGIRAAWANGKLFGLAYPGEKEYRHSLREETEALKAVVDLVLKNLKEGKIKKLQPGLEALVKLAENGLLESFVLLTRPDRGIAQDYAAYRAEHREKLREYLSKFVVPETR